MKFGYNNIIKHPIVFLLQFDTLIFFSLHSLFPIKQNVKTKEQKGFDNEVNISPNKKSLNLTPFFPKGNKFFMKVIIIPFLKS